MKLKETKIVSIASLKGGIGKTTDTAMVANYIHHFTNYSCCVIDIDHQSSLSDIRNDEMDNNPGDINPFEIIGVQNPFDNKEDIEKIVPKMVVDEIIMNLDALKGNVDFIFIDLPGTIDQKGVLELYALVNHLFIPTGLSSLDLKSFVKFYSYYVQKIIPIKDKYNIEHTIHAYLHAIDSNTNQFKEFQEIKNEYPVNFLYGFTTYSRKTYQDEFSTLKPLKHQNKKNQQKLTQLCKEIVKIIKTENY